MIRITFVTKLLYINLNKNILLIMIVIGLLSTKQEVDEIKYIVKVCDVEDRIRFVVRMQKLKELLKKEQSQ